MIKRQSDTNENAPKDGGQLTVQIVGCVIVAAVLTFAAFFIAGYLP